jgi:hypothetical protein
MEMSGGEVGFTGTERGMTDAQVRSLEDLLASRYIRKLHHGCCIGADAQAHEIALGLFIRPVLHPPENPKKRAVWSGSVNDSREPKPYLDRNHDIVDESRELIAAPRGFKEELRSGTWATIRYTLKVGKPVRIIWPDGQVEEVKSVSDLQR